MTHTYSASLSIHPAGHISFPKNFAMKSWKGQLFQVPWKVEHRWPQPWTQWPDLGELSTSLLGVLATGRRRVLPPSETTAWSTQPLLKQGPRRVGLGARKNVFFGRASAFQIPSRRLPSSRKDSLWAIRQARWAAVPWDFIVTIHSPNCPSRAALSSCQATSRCVWPRKRKWQDQTLFSMRYESRIS